jgi:hypothetical protein
MAHGHHISGCTNTYVEASFDPQTRLAQHNGQIPGGPRATKRVTGLWSHRLVLVVPAARTDIPIGVLLRLWKARHRKLLYRLRFGLLAAQLLGLPCCLDVAVADHPECRGKMEDSIPPEMLPGPSPTASSEVVVADTPTVVVATAESTTKEDVDAVREARARRAVELGSHRLSSDRIRRIFERLALTHFAADGTRHEEILVPEGADPPAEQQQSATATAAARDWIRLLDAIWKEERDEEEARVSGIPLPPKPRKRDTKKEAATAGAGEEGGGGGGEETPDGAEAPALAPPDGPPEKRARNSWAALTASLKARGKTTPEKVAAKTRRKTHVVVSKTTMAAVLAAANAIGAGQTLRLDPNDPNTVIAVPFRTTPHYT